MNVREILFHIDAELDRLKRARAVLAEEPLLAKKRRRKRSRGPTTERRSAPIAVDLKPGPSIPPVTRYPIKVFRKRVLRRTKTLLKDEMERKPTALCNSIPSGPVAISAEEVRQARARQNIGQGVADGRLKQSPIQERSLGTLIVRLHALPDAPKLFPQTESPHPSS